MNDNTFRNRITDLRKKKGVSEYKMSLDMGKNKGYIQSIVSGRTLPSMSEFFAMCEYLGVKPNDFFDVDIENPAILDEAFEKIRNLNEDGLRAIMGLADMLSDRYKNRA